MEEEKSFLENVNSTLKIDRDYVNEQFDYEWLEKIEETLPYIDNILRNPKRFIINEEEVVKVELAKKTTVESVIHLTQHTNLIQDFDEKTGDVKPSKVLNILRDESLDTYENRFVYTLIENLTHFYDDRIRTTGTKSQFRDKKIIKYTANTKIGDEAVEINIDVNSLNKSENEVIDDLGQSIPQRLTAVKTQLDGFRATELYRTLTKLHVPPVRSPIRKTNVILKNPNFQKAEELWNYIQLFVSKDKREVDKSDYYETGVIKQNYDNAFNLIYTYNSQIGNNTSRATFERRVSEMSEAFINNLLESNENATIDYIKDTIIKKIDKIKEINEKRYETILSTFDDKLDRELNNFENLVNFLTKED